MPQDGLVSENNARYRCVEPGSYGAGHTAADKDIRAQNPLGPLPQEAPHRGAKMHKRAVLTHRGTAARRNEGGQCRAKPRFDIQFVVASVSRMNGVRRAMPALDAKQASDNQYATNRHQKTHNGTKRDWEIFGLKQIEQPAFPIG